MLPLDFGQVELRFRYLPSYLVYLACSVSVVLQRYWRFILIRVRSYQRICCVFVLYFISAYSITAIQRISVGYFHFKAVRFRVIRYCIVQFRRLIRIRQQFVFIYSSYLASVLIQFPCQHRSGRRVRYVQRTRIQLYFVISAIRPYFQRIPYSRSQVS